MARLTLTLLLIIPAAVSNAQELEQRGFNFNKIRDKVVDSIFYLTQLLEIFNDNYFGRSAFGKYIKYDELKPTIDSTGIEESRGMKKMAMGMIPLIFHMGATSTWMILTTILAAKSVLIGVILLVFKIAVSAAKVGSFFTTLKANSGHGHHHEWWSQPPEHGYRSLSEINRLN